jgi:hypothetical protein
MMPSRTYLNKRKILRQITGPQSSVFGAVLLKQSRFKTHSQYLFRVGGSVYHLDVQRDIVKRDTRLAVWKLHMGRQWILSADEIQTLVTKMKEEIDGGPEIHDGGN